MNNCFLGYKEMMKNGFRLGRNQRFRLVEGVLYDMVNDPELVAEMKAAYEKFWDESRPLMINDGVPLAKEKPYHIEYKAQKASKGIPDWEEPSL